MNKSVDSTPAFAGFSRFQIFLGGFLLSRTCQTRENTLPQTQSTESRRRTTTEKNTWLDRQKSIDGPDVVRYRWKSDFYLITRCILAVNCRQNLYSRTINSRCPIKSSSWSSTTRPQPHTHAHSQTTPRHTHTPTNSIQLPSARGKITRISLAPQEISFFFLFVFLVSVISRAVISFLFRLVCINFRLFGAHKSRRSQSKWAVWKAEGSENQPKTNRIPSHSEIFGMSFVFSVFFFGSFAVVFAFLTLSICSIWFFFSLLLVMVVKI